MSCKTSRSRGLKLSCMRARSLPLLTRRATAVGEIMLMPSAALRAASSTSEAGSDFSTCAGAGFDGSEAGIVAAVTTQKHKARGRKGLANHQRRVASRAVVEVEIHNHDVRCGQARQSGGVLDGACLADNLHIALTVEEQPQALGHELVVLHDDNANASSKAEIKVGRRFAANLELGQCLPQDSSARLVTYRASSCSTTAAMGGYSSTRATRSRSRNVPNHPQISSSCRCPAHGPLRMAKGPDPPSGSWPLAHT